MDQHESTEEMACHRVVRHSSKHRDGTYIVIMSLACGRRVQVEPDGILDKAWARNEHDFVVRLVLVKAL